jgi:hypothetical protein
MVFRSIDGKFKYKIGVIDFLTDYGSLKKVETTFNNIVHWRGRQEASC